MESTNAATKMRFKVAKNEVGQDMSDGKAAQMQVEVPKNKATSSCSILGTSCDEDCDCCGYDENVSIVRCERRNLISGYKCYQNGQIGDSCSGIWVLTSIIIIKNLLLRLY